MNGLWNKWIKRNPEICRFSLIKQVIQMSYSSVLPAWSNGFTRFHISFDLPLDSLVLQLSYSVDIIGLYTYFYSLILVFVHKFSWVHFATFILKILQHIYDFVIPCFQVILTSNWYARLYSWSYKLDEFQLISSFEESIVNLGYTGIHPNL